MEEQKNISELISQVKSNSQQKTIQKVIPVVQKGIEETQFSFYIEKQLLKTIKFKAIENNVSIKSIINSALVDFVEKNRQN